MPESQEIQEIISIMKTGKKSLAWKKLSTYLEHNPNSETGWELAYKLASPQNKAKVAEKARSYLHPNSTLWSEEKKQNGNVQRPKKNENIFGTLEKLIFAFLVMCIFGLVFIMTKPFEQQTPIATQALSSAPDFTAELPSNSIQATTTDTPQSNQYSAQTKYIEEINISARGFFRALDDFHSLHNQYESDPFIKIYDPWEDQMEQTVANLAKYSRQMAAVRPVPPELTDFSSTLKSLRDETVDFVDIYRDWLEHGNRTTLTSAFIRFNRMNFLLDQLESELGEMLENIGQ